MTATCSGNRLTLDGKMVSDFRLIDPVWGTQTFSVEGEYKIGKEYELEIRESRKGEKCETDKINEQIRRG